MSEEIAPLGSTTVDGHTRSSARIRNRIMSSQTPSNSQADTSTPAPKPKAKRGSAARGKSSSGPPAPGTPEVGGYTPSPDVLNMLLNQMHQNNPYNLSQPDDGIPDDSHSREKDTHRKDGDPNDSNKKDSNKKDTQNRDGHGHKDKDSPSPDYHPHAKDTIEQGYPNDTPSGNGSGGTPLGTPGQGGPGGGPTDPSATKGAGTPPGGGPTPPLGLGGQDHPKTDQPDLSKVPANLEILPPRFLAQWAMRWREANRSLAHWSRNFTGGSQADQDLWMDQNIEAYFDYQRLVRLHGTEQNPISDPSIVVTPQGPPASTSTVSNPSSGNTSSSATNPAQVPHQPSQNQPPHKRPRLDDRIADMLAPTDHRTGRREEHQQEPPHPDWSTLHHNAADANEQAFLASIKDHEGKVAGGGDPPVGGTPAPVAGKGGSSYVDPNAWLNEVFRQSAPPSGGAGGSSQSNPSQAQIQLLVQKALSAAHNNQESLSNFGPQQPNPAPPIEGKEPNASSLDSPSLAGLISSGIASHVAPALVEKVISGKYINLALLLPRDYDESDSEEEGRELGNLDYDFANHKVTVKCKSRKKIRDFPTWQRAWAIFMTIYCAKFPDQYPALLQYAENIRVMAYSAGAQGSKGYLVYDKAWRESKARYPSKRWDLVDNELWNTKLVLGNLQAMAATIKSFKGQNQGQAQGWQQTNQPSKGKGRRSRGRGGGGSQAQPQAQAQARPSSGPPPGLRNRRCKYFNKPEGCNRSDCWFKHACQGCGSTQHGKHQCSQSSDR